MGMWAWPGITSAAHGQRPRLRHPEPAWLALVHQPPSGRAVGVPRRKTPEEHGHLFHHLMVVVSQQLAVTRPAQGVMEEKVCPLPVPAAAFRSLELVHVARDDRCSAFTGTIWEMTSTPPAAPLRTRSTFASASTLTASPTVGL